jgi:hypothetical protein
MEIVQERLTIKFLSLGPCSTFPLNSRIFLQITLQGRESYSQTEIEKSLAMKFLMFMK